MKEQPVCGSGGGGGGGDCDDNSNDDNICSYTRNGRMTHNCSELLEL